MPTKRNKKAHDRLTIITKGWISHIAQLVCERLLEWEEINRSPPAQPYKLLWNQAQTEMHMSFSN